MSELSILERLYISPSSPSGLRYIHAIYSKHGQLLQPKNRPAGARNADGYWVIDLGNKSYRAHRLIYELAYGKPPPGVVDHIDGDPSNNNIENLRSVTKSVNARNGQRKTLNAAGKTGVQLVVNAGYKYWAARWDTNEGKRMKKYFSVARFGDAAAFDLACQHREAMLFDAGGYTQLHGTVRTQ